MMSIDSLSRIAVSLPCILKTSIPRSNISSQSFFHGGRFAAFRDDAESFSSQLEQEILLILSLKYWGLSFSLVLL